MTGQDRPTPGLAGKTVVVTRPAHQNAAFCRRLAAAGAIALPCPLVDITPPRDPRPMHCLIADLDTYDLLIFNSPNAVHGVLPAIAERGLPPRVRIAAIGARTAAAIGAYGLPVHLCPERDFDSEALLALLELQSVAGLRVAILRGQSGRDLTRATLAARGAEVRYVSVYERRPPSPERLAAIADTLLSTEFHAVAITSGEAFQILWRDMEGPVRDRLAQALFVMGSGRIAELARSEGLQARLVIADNPSDDAMFAALEQAFAGA